MTDSICGINCGKYPFQSSCCGCSKTNGRPFGKDCIVALNLRKGEKAYCAFKEKLIAAFNELHIPDMDKVTDLNALKGSFINLPYKMPGGQMVKIWDDDRIYLGNQLHKKNSDRCYGIAADERYLMVCEYGKDGADAELVVFCRWN